MNFDPTKDYYKILGVPNNATPEAIRDAYRKRVKDIGLDRLIGLLNKTTDADVKKVIQEQIDLKTETMKEINEAKEVLSDSLKRADYNSMRKGKAPASTVSGPPPPKPEIVFSKSILNFGTVNKGDGGSKIVTITGSAQDSIQIIWETQPAWAKPLLIETDPVSTFPITVTVEIKTGRIAPASYSTDIIVTADGEVFRLPVHLKVVEVMVPKVAPTPTRPRPKPTPAAPHPKPRPAPAPVYTPPPSTAKIPWGWIIGALVILGVITMLRANSNPSSTIQTKNCLMSRLHVGETVNTGDSYWYLYQTPNSGDSSMFFPATLTIVGGPVTNDQGEVWWQVRVDWNENPGLHQASGKPSGMEVRQL